MKKQLLIFLVLFASIALYSQNYQGYVPFPDSNATWVDEYSYSYGATNTNVCQDKEMTLGKDTIIDSLWYVEMKFQLKIWNHDFGFYCRHGSYYSIKGIYGYMRNDTINKKVWIRYPNDTLDTILYDFDLKLGDTLPSDSIYIIDSIDTVLIGNQYRKRFRGERSDSICATSHHAYLIEGIGLSVGFNDIYVAWCNSHSRSSNLHCFKLNGQTIYPDTSYTCYLITGINQGKVEKDGVMLFPNPTEGTINLSTETQLQSIEVYNLQGQKIQEINSKERSWQLPKESGLYLIRLQDEEGKVYTEKVIKE